MQIPTIDVNSLIIAALVLGALYGVFAGKFHLRLFILSIYVGLVLAERLTAIVQPYLTALGPDQISWLLFGAPILLFSFAPRGHHGAHAEKGSSLLNLFVGLLAGALVAAAALHILPTSQLSDINDASFLAYNLNLVYIWLLGGLPLAVIILTLHSPKPKGHH